MKWVRWRAVIDRTATARIQRLIRWLEPFQRCFGHRAQRLALRTYVHGLFSDSDRKSMQAMLARVTDPITYQGFQHFITHATWDADHIWRRLLEALPERRGVLIIDGTSFPKQGTHGDRPAGVDKDQLRARPPRARARRDLDGRCAGKHREMTRHADRIRQVPPVQRSSERGDIAELGVREHGGELQSRGAGAIACIDFRSLSLNRPCTYVRRASRCARWPKQR